MKKDQLKNLKKRVKRLKEIKPITETAIGFNSDEFNAQAVYNRINQWKTGQNKNHPICNAKIIDFSSVEEESLVLDDDISNKITNSLYQQMSDNFNFKFKTPTNFKYLLTSKLSFFKSRKGKDIPEIIIPHTKNPIEVEFPMGFPTYNNCLFVCNDMIIHIIELQDEFNLKWWDVTVWTIVFDKVECVLLIFGTRQEGDILYYNPINLLLDYSNNAPILVEYHKMLIVPFIIIIKIWTLLNQRKPITYIPLQGNGTTHKANTNSQESEIITIDINPNINRVLTISNNRSSGIKKKYHEVATHTRRYKSGKVVQVKSHHRGDPSLGVSNKIHKIIDSRKIINI